MNRTNKKYLSLMNKVLDGEASESERRELNGYLADCDDCRRHFKEMEGAVSLLRRLPYPQLPATFTKSVLNRLPEDRQHMVRRWGGRHPVLTTFALCALPLVMFGARRQFREKDHYVLIKVPEGGN